MSLEEIAQRLGMSRQNVQLIERRALNKLRKACGSTFRGSWKHYEVEGVPEPAEGYRDYSTKAKTQPRRACGRFSR
jgi:biotin operon repressor